VAGEDQAEGGSRREDVREAVRDAMTGLLREKPFKTLTIDEIARAAGLTRTAFYFYFKNKTEVLATALEEVSAELYVEADRWWSGGGDPQQQLREALDGITRVYAQHPDVMRVALELSGYDADVATLYRRLVARFVVASAEHIRGEQAAGRARPIDADRMAESLVWMTERCCDVFICLDRRDPAQVVAALVAIWVRALYPDEVIGA
jgi:TetR/AcrR family transcriptional regulator, ethionamide resistance regulator